MVKLITLSLLVAVAIWLGLGMHHDMGMIVIALKQTTVELPLWLGVIGLLLAYSVFYIMVHLVGGLIRLPNAWRNWRMSRQHDRALSVTHRGFMDLAEQNWLSAERHLVRGIESNDLPVLNYLGAAEAAQAQGAHQRRDKYLKLAHASEKHTVAVDLKAAEFELAHGQLETAIARLTKLQETHPAHPAVLLLLKKAYVTKQDWSALYHLLPTIKKKRIVVGADFVSLERQALQGLLQAASREQTVSHLQSAWDSLPKAYQRDPFFISIYIEGLISYQHHELAEKELVQVIKQHWREDWVAWYGSIEHSQPQKALGIAEGWMKSHPNSAMLFLTLGRLAEKSQIWGQAERYFEISLSLAPSKAVYAALGLLYERLGQPSKSQLCYRKGLLLAVDSKSAASEQMRQLQDSPPPVIPSQSKTE